MTTSDAEVICNWMEPLSGIRVDWWRLPNPNAAWLPVLTICPPLELLGRLYEVEERLSGEQRAEYYRVLAQAIFDRRKEDNFWWESVHANSEQKSRALAVVIRTSTHTCVALEARQE